MVANDSAMSVGAITRKNVVTVRETLRVGKCDRSCIGILLMASKYRHEAKTKLTLEFRPTLLIDFAIRFIYGDFLLMPATAIVRAIQIY